MEHSIVMESVIASEKSQTPVLAIEFSYSTMAANVVIGKGRKMQTLKVSILRVGGKASSGYQEVNLPDSLKLAKDGDKPEPGKGMFRIMTPEDGDVRVVWDSRSLDEIEDAKMMFDELKDKGLTPFKVGVDGQATSEEMEEFDCEAEEIIFLPMEMVAGG